MVTYEDIKKCNSIYALPKDIHYNKDVMLDYRLVETFEENGKKSITGDLRYDFDIYLPKYGINLQRPYVWKRQQQNEFISTILMDKPIEHVVAVIHNSDRDRNNTIVQIIDGKQRLMTIKKFVNNEFPVKIGDKEVYWNDFDNGAKMYFRSRANGITAMVYYSYDNCPITEDMKIMLFNFYNFAGTPQTQKHKNELQALLNN